MNLLDDRLSCTWDSRKLESEASQASLCSAISEKSLVLKLLHFLSCNPGHSMNRIWTM